MELVALLESSLEEPWLVEEAWTLNPVLHSDSTIAETRRTTASAQNPQILNLPIHPS